MSQATLLALLPLLPLAGFAVNGVFGARLPRSVVGAVACAMPALAFAAALALFAALPGDGSALRASYATWAATGNFAVDIGLHFDALSAVMCLVITGIGTLIHVYSIGYMLGDDGYARYFAYLNLFLFFMLLLVLGSNLVVLFVGWEGVGLASYLLIGYWFRDADKTAAGVKAFVVNRVGDTAFLIAAFVIVATAGTLDFEGIAAAYAAAPPSPGVLTAVGVLLLLGACGKSAQIPLHVWLPDAMAGPTPVSALIHAATMVTAGVYLLARMHGVYVASPDAMAVVAWVGAITALAGATMGVVQFNLKKVLAYSTMSQIGLMVMACGVGAFSAGMFHLVTHAFFKACLFLAVGAVLHALAGEEDMRRMGGLARRLPFTFAVFVVATLALAGVPPLAGFFSKDEILWWSYAAERGSTALWLVGSAASLLTAFYMFRAVFLTFFGASRVAPAASGHVHDPPTSMALPLAVLALGAVVVGWIGLPLGWQHLFGVGAPFYELLAPRLPAPALRDGVAHSTEWVLMTVAVALAAAGIFAAWRRYGGDRGAAAIAAAPRAGAIGDVVRHGYGFDATYARVVAALGWLSTAVLARRVEPALRWASVDRPADSGPAASRWAARLQTGNVQTYVIYALVGLALVLGWGAVHG